MELSESPTAPAYIGPPSEKFTIRYVQPTGDRLRPCGTACCNPRHFYGTQRGKAHRNLVSETVVPGPQFPYLLDTPPNQQDHPQHH